MKKVGPVAKTFFWLTALPFINIIMVNASGQWGDVLMVSVAADVMFMLLFGVIGLIAMAVYQAKQRKQSPKE